MYLTKMRYSINDKTLAAEKARILIKALIECVKAGVKPSFVTNQMLWGISLYLECGKFKKENRRTYSRVSDAARRVVESGDKDWKRKVTFEHVRPLSKMYQMMFEERKTLTPERAAYIIGEYPPILITLEDGVTLSRPIIWIGHRTVELATHVNPDAAAPIRIRAVNVSGCARPPAYTARRVTWGCRAGGGRY